LSQVLQAVYIDMNTKRIVALTPQPEFWDYVAGGTHVT
jgi:hypothetical protein